MNITFSLSAQALLLDLDGTLIDSSALYEKVWTRWSRVYGLDPIKTIEVSHGRQPRDTVNALSDGALDRGAALTMFYEEEAKENDVGTVAGAKRFLESLPSRRWGIVTSSGRSLALRRLRHCDLPVPEVLVAADDVPVGKPSPFGYLLAAKCLGVPARECLVAEDAPTGVEAGHRSGALVVVLATTYGMERFPNDNVINNWDSARLETITKDGRLLLTFVGQPGDRAAST